jgi:protein-tyrosine kinase
MNDFQSNPQAQSVQDPSLGDILRRTKGLTSEQVALALEYQRSNGVRFGAAVVALGLAQTEDVIWALSQQFHYPYTPVGESALNEELVVANTPFDENVEAFRDLRTQLLTSTMGPGPERSALAIVSAEVAEGKTFVAANLATAFSQLPGNTLVIDADLRTPRLHKVFGVEASTGLSGILAGRTEPNVIRPVGHLPNLYLLPAGTVPPNPTELLQRAAMGLLLRELLSKFDNVIVDTPAAGHGPDARIIATHCGAAMLVGRKQQSKTADMQALLKHLTKSKIKIAGVLVNEF